MEISQREWLLLLAAITFLVACIALAWELYRTKQKLATMEAEFELYVKLKHGIPNRRSSDHKPTASQSKYPGPSTPIIRPVKIVKPK